MDDNILIATSDRLFKKLAGPSLFESGESAELYAPAWDELEESGLSKATTSEARGGAGASWAEAMSIVQLAGSYALPLPLAETLMAELLLAAAGLPARDGGLTVGPVVRNGGLVLTRAGQAWRANGELRRVPWGRHLPVVATGEADGQPVTVVLDQPSSTRMGLSEANEPRDTLIYNDVDVADDQVGKPGSGFGRSDVYALGALFRSVQMFGALLPIRDMTVVYAGERQQFGRPIAKFQAVQQQLAVLASHTAAAGAACDAAVEASANGLSPFEIAIAKARVGEAAGLAAAIAHQVHGAMGFTHEYPLHRLTRRLWGWRDEFGTEAHWQEWIGHNIIASDQVLWELLTDRERSMSMSLAEHHREPASNG